MTASSVVVDDLARASTAIQGVIASLGADQWGASTPCPDWTVRDLVGHLVQGDRMFAALLAGEPIAGLDGDLLGGDPAAAYRSSSGGLADVAGHPEALQRSCAGPLGDNPTGEQLLQLRMADLLVHGWDLHRAIGTAALPVPDDLTERALAFMQTYLSDGMRGAQFDPPQPVHETAPAADRLAAFCGRSVTAQP